MNSQDSVQDSGPILSKEDIDRLLRDRSPRTQIDVVNKLAEQYAAEGAQELNAQQIIIANDIFRLLLARGETIVRSMLAMTLSQIEKLPPELARQMAEDAHIEVAGPVLQYSEALTDEDLTRIISGMVDTQKLKAIAQRDRVSETVSDMLVSTNVEAVVQALVENEGAEISDASFDEILQHHGANADIIECMLQRSSAPVAVIERVIESISAPMRKQLEAKYGKLADIQHIHRALDKSMELANLKMLGLSGTDAELEALVRQLHKTHTLSPFTALAMCNLQLFEVSMSRLLRVPLKNVQRLLKDVHGFALGYARAKLPPELREACWHAVQTLRQPPAPPGNVRLLISQMESSGKDVPALSRLSQLLQHSL